jgi:hypothetical protein
MASPKATSAASPKASVASPRATALPKTSEEIDFSLLSWVTNTHSVLHWPLTILIVAGLLVLGSFIEIAPRKSLKFLDNLIGRALFFIIPFLIAVLIDWPTGLLAATVSLIIFARLQKEDSSEGFSDIDDNSTQLISNSHRWFIERVMGERPVAISSDRARTTAGDNNIRSYSSSKITSLPSDSFWSKFNGFSYAGGPAMPTGSSWSTYDSRSPSSTKSSSMPVGSSSSSHK